MRPAQTFSSQQQTIDQQRAFEFEQYRVFQELKNAQHVEINQYQTVIAIMTSNLKLFIYDAITRNLISETNLQEFTKIDTTVKQSAYGKCGEVMMRFFKNTNFLGVYIKNTGEFLVLKIGGNPVKEIKKLQLQDKLTFIEMDPFSKNTFIFGARGIEMGNIKTQRVLCIEQGSNVEVKIEEQNEDIKLEDMERSMSTEKQQEEEDDDGELKQEYVESKINDKKQNGNVQNIDQRIRKTAAENGQENMMIEGNDAEEDSGSNQQEEEEEDDDDDNDQEDDEYDEEEESEEANEDQEEKEEEYNEEEEESESNDEGESQESSFNLGDSGQSQKSIKKVKKIKKQKKEQKNKITQEKGDKKVVTKKATLKQATEKQFFIASKTSGECENNCNTVQAQQNKQGDNDNEYHTANAIRQGDQNIKLERGEIKLMNSSSCALYLKQRSSKNRKVILGIVNRDIVIYEVTITQSKELSSKLINRFKLNDLQMYDMSHLQLSSNLQNNKFVLAIDKKFMHILSLSESLNISPQKEEFLVNNIIFLLFLNVYLCRLRIKQRDILILYSGEILMRKTDQNTQFIVIQMKETIFNLLFLFTVDNTNLNCSIVFQNLATAKKTIVILQADKPRMIFHNLRWEGSLGVIGEGGGMFIIESPRQHYWENFSYRFRGLEKNSYYIEKEDEFDFQKDVNKIRQLTLHEFDNLKTNYADFIYPQLHKIISDGTLSLS